MNLDCDFLIFPLPFNNMTAFGFSPKMSVQSNVCRQVAFSVGVATSQLTELLERVDSSHTLIPLSEPFSLTVSILQAVFLSSSSVTAEILGFLTDFLHSSFL